MVVKETPLETVADGLDAIAPVKTGTATSLGVAIEPVRINTSHSTCSVATEVEETRDASESRGEDGGRDGADRKEMTKRESVPVSASLAPSLVSSVAAKSGHSDSRNILTRTGDTIDSAIQHFYSSLELGAEKLWDRVTCSAHDETEEAKPSAESAPGAVELLGESNQESTLKKSKSEETVKTVSARSAKTDVTQKTSKTLPAPVQSTKEKSGCCVARIFGCQGQEEHGLENASFEIEGIIGDTIGDITTGGPHILDTFSDINTVESQLRSPRNADDNTLERDKRLQNNLDDNTVESDERSKRALRYVEPKAKSLLKEIKAMEDSLLEVRKTASMENVEKIKKRQDPFIQKMATIKQLLLDQQAILESAPADAKEEYYRTISRAAILNAEVETQRAELELKKIKLESMRIEDEMERMTYGFDGTFDSMDETLMSKESGEGFQHVFNMFARYASGRFPHKAKKNKGRGRQVRA